MPMPKLTIGKRTAHLPIIQGGMAVRISMSRLAAAVANSGGIGIVAGSGLEPDEFAVEVRQAREATDGVLGVNVMVAVRRFADLVKTAIAEGVDLVIAGAGFSRDVFEWCRDAGVEMVPVVGSERVARLAEKFGASAVVVEGVEAGGHLGTDESVRALLPRILDAVSIPVIAAGDICTGADIHGMIQAGASGVQMGSRFAATVESNASDGFKRMYVDATEEDVMLINSPVGLPGRALRNPFTEKLLRGEVPRIENCVVCLKKCQKDYCIIDKLVRAQQGDVDEGLVFAGQSVTRIHDIPTVRELIDRLVSEYEAAAEGAPA